MTAKRAKSKKQAADSNESEQVNSGPQKTIFDDEPADTPKKAKRTKKADKAGSNGGASAS